MSEPINGSKLNDLFWIVDRPKTVQEVEMDARLADYLELCEQAFIAGWTDCEEKITSKQHKTDAYYTGYYQCMKFEGDRDE